MHSQQDPVASRFRQLCGLVKAELSQGFAQVSSLSKYLVNPSDQCVLASKLGEYKAVSIKSNPGPRQLYFDLLRYRPDTMAATHARRIRYLRGVDYEERVRREQEREEYHSISRSIHDRPHNELPRYYYEPPELPSSYDAETTGYLVVARFIPPDERIQLPFDSYWQIQEDEYECQREQYQFESADGNENLEDRLRDKAKSKVQSLNAFFGPEFWEFGSMIVWDINPSEPADYLEYNLNKRTFFRPGFGGNGTNWEDQSHRAAIRSCIGEFAQRCEKMQRLSGAPLE